MTGRTLLAPLLAIVTVAHHAELVQARVDHSFYLARDAWPFFAVAERLCTLLPAPAPATYLRLSRRAVSLAHPGQLLATTRGLAGRFGKRTAGELLAAFDLSAALHHDLLEAARLNDDSRLTAAARRAVRGACDLLEAPLRQAADEQRALLRDLLEQAAGPNARRLALIDTGWAGTTQDALAAALGGHDLLGLYLGVSGGGLDDAPSSRKRGLLWDLPRGLAPLSPLERTAGVIRIWELLLREPAPTVRGLCRRPDGRVDVDLLDLRDHPDVEASAELAAGVGAGVTALTDTLRRLLASVPPPHPAWRRAARALACHLTTRPDRALAHAVLSLDYDEGAVQGVRTRLGAPGLRRGVGWIPGIALQLGGQVGLAAVGHAATVVGAVTRR